MAAITNTLTGIMSKILSRALLALREVAIMPRIVNGDYNAEAAQKGSTIDVPVPTAMFATDVVPSNTPPAPSDTALTTVQIQLNKWKKVNFGLTDKDLGEIDRNAAFMPMEMSEAVRALANAVNASLFEESRFIYNTAGTASFVPFDSASGGPGVTSATDLRKVMNQQNIPRGDRRAVLDFSSEANMLALPQFSDAEKIASAGVKIEGEIGRKFGIDWFADDGVINFKAGSITTGLVLHAAENVAVGAKVANVTTAGSSGAVALLPGDIIKFAGDDQTYVLTNSVIQASAASDAIINFEPGKIVASSGSEAVTVGVADHAGGIGFHRDAFACAIRPLAASMADLALGNQIITMTDPVTGISLRLEVSRQYKQTMWELDILWGAKLVRPQLAVRLIGKP